MSSAGMEYRHTGHVLLCDIVQPEANRQISMRINTDQQNKSNLRQPGCDAVLAKIMEARQADSLTSRFVVLPADRARELTVYDVITHDTVGYSKQPNVWYG